MQDPEIRQGIKEYSDWPTIPQLYVKGEFVGGSDIMMEMFESGELQQLVGAEASSSADKQKGTVERDQKPLHRPFRWRGTKWTPDIVAMRRANLKKRRKTAIFYE